MTIPPQKLYISQQALSKESGPNASDKAAEIASALSRLAMTGPGQAAT